MSVVNIKPAATGRYTHKYNPLSVASLDFGDLIASRVTEVEKSDDWKFNEVKGTLRLAPQVFPAYGKNTLKTAVFFVPSNQLVEYYDQFRNNKAVWKGKAVRLPSITGLTILQMFYDRPVPANAGPYDGLYYDEGSNSSFGALTNILETNGTHWDFVYFDTTPTTPLYHACRLSAKGKKFYKVLKMLGYDFACYDYTAASTSDVLYGAQTRLNILPLLAYFKCYTDYFLNAQLYNTDPLVGLLQHIHDDDNYSNGYFVYYNGSIDSDCLYACLEHILVPYESNMYLQAWNSPNSPTGVSPDSEMIGVNGNGLISPYSPPISSIPGTILERDVSFESNSDSTIMRQEQGGGFAYFSGLSKVGLNILDSIYKFVRRNNLFGSKPIQQVLARFGIKDSDWNSHFVHKIYEGVSDIDYSAVVSQTDNYSSSSGTGKTLGAYAGFGISGLNFKFDYKSSDHGYLIVLHWLQITPILKRGFDPSVMRVFPQDFYTPEFDGQTLRAIPYMEISTDKWGRNSTMTDRKVYGFTDLYEDYRNMRDSVIGDFVTDEGGVDNFVFDRDFSYWRSSGSAVAFKPQQSRIQYMNRDGINPDMSDPFQMSQRDGDRFYLFMKFDITASRHVTSKSSSLDLNGEGDLSIQLGGTQIS